MGSNGKTDMERLGIFSEQGYISLKDPYPKQDPKSRSFNEAAGKGKQMLPGGSKSRAGTQAGYFDNTYMRVLEGEAYSDAIKRRRAERIKNAKSNIVSKAWLPSSFTKKPTGLGNHHGTFGGMVPSFQPNKVQGKPYKTPGRNFTTTPGKKGTGYGYLNVTFQKYHDHKIDPYDRARELRAKDHKEHMALCSKVTTKPFRLHNHPKTFFDGNPYRTDKPLPKSKPKAELSKKGIKTPFRPSHPPKAVGGCKAGTFESYPKHSEDRYTGKVMGVTGVRSDKGIKVIFKPSPGPKSTPTRSTLDTNVTKSINRNNYKQVKHIMAF